MCERGVEKVEEDNVPAAYTDRAGPGGPDHSNIGGLLTIRFFPEKASFHHISSPTDILDFFFDDFLFFFLSSPSPPSASPAADDDHPAFPPRCDPSTAPRNDPPRNETQRPFRAQCSTSASTIIPGLRVPRVCLATE